MLAQARVVVIKVGSAVLTDAQGLNAAVLDSLAGQLARLAGMPGYARRVGRAMAAAPAGIPSHRVVSAAGRTVPGWTAQRELLEAEGIRFRRNGCVDLAHLRDEF